ncbi:hypothetical protein [Streptomyces sp. Amel2xB2]|nr:hypothetical protein [Streptomyces sp. Amel2xB2]
MRTNAGGVPGARARAGRREARRRAISKTAMSTTTSASGQL